MNCDSCGAELGEVVIQCPFCGARLLAVVSLEEETKALLDTLETRLQEEVARRSNTMLTLYFFLFLAPGPVSYFLLGPFAGASVLERLGLAALLVLLGFMLFGWQVLTQEGRAEQVAWRDSIGPAIRRYTERKGFSDTEFMVFAQRLLKEDSRLRKLLASG